MMKRLMICLETTSRNRHYWQSAVQKKVRRSEKRKGKEALIPTRLRNPAKEKTKGKKKVTGQTKSKGHSYGPGRGEGYGTPLLPPCKWPRTVATHVVEEVQKACKAPQF